MNKQHKSVAEVFEETKKKLTVEQHDESANLAQLKRTLDMINDVVQQYGSNSLERSHLHGAENLIHDAIAVIGQKDLDGTYTAQGSIEYESRVEQKDAGRNKATADKIQRIMKEMDKLDDKVVELYNQIESAVWNEFDPATMDSQDPRQSLIAAWKISGVSSLDETLADWRNIF